MKILSHFSGGYDSIASTISMLNKGHTVTGIFFNIGQQYYTQELKAVTYISKILHNKYANWQGCVEHKLDLELKSNDNSPSAYIPVRNFAFIAVSANYAIAHNMDAIAVGNKTVEIREEDPYSFRDCSVTFYDMVTNIINYCSEPSAKKVNVVMPLVIDGNAVSKSDVLEIIHDAGIDLNKLWSCYEDGDVPCGACYHCMEVKTALEESSISDYPLIFK